MPGTEPVRRLPRGPERPPPRVEAPPPRGACGPRPIDRYRLAATVVTARGAAAATDGSAGRTVEATMTASQHDGATATQHSFTTR